MDLKNDLEYPLDEETRDGCYVCGEGGVLDESKLQEIHRCDPSMRPKFMEPKTVAWRTEREYRLAYDAWKKMSDKYAKQALPEVSLEHVEKNESELGEDEEFSDHIEPVIREAPVQEKSYPLTVESRKKRLERTNTLKKEEKRAAIESLRKKQEELRKLKEEYRKETARQECHLKERRADYERRKQQYLELLAREQGVEVELLQARGDEVYRAYRQECKAWQALKMDKIKRQEKILEKLELEKQKAKEVKLKSGKAEKFHDTLSWEEANIQEVFEAARAALENTERAEGEKGDKVGVVSSLARPVSRTYQAFPRRAASRLPSGSRPSRATTVRKRSTKSAGSWKRRTIISNRLRKEPSSEDQEYPACAEMTEGKESLLEGELREAMGQMAGILREMQEVRAGQEESLPLDRRIIPTPSSILIQDFYPAETRIAKIKMYNSTTKKMYIQMYKIILQPPGDSETMKVWPPEIIKIWPGNCSQFEVMFSTISWGEVEEFEGKIWFWTCCPPKCDDVRYLGIDVKCTRASTNPQVVNKEICFLEKDPRGRKFYKEYITIENRGCMNCRVYINRVVDNVLEWYKRETRVNTRPLTLSKTKKSRIGKSKTVSPHLDRGPPENLSHEVVEYIINLLIEIILSPFRIHLARGRVLKGMSSISVPVRFAPHMADTCYSQERLRVIFEGFDSWRKEEVVKLWGTLAGPVVEAVPPVLDLKTLVIGSRGNQAVSSLRNLTDKFQTVRARLPGRMSRHFQLEPASVLLRPREETNILIRSNLGWNFLEDGAEFLKELNAVLEFWVELLPEDGPPTSLMVLGTVALPLGLTIHPEILNLGELNTTESTVREFYLINHSMMEQEVAFLNLPEWCVVLPGYGFVRLSPYQKLKMQFLYSPTYIQAGGPGGKALHAFEIHCTTVRRLASLSNPKAFPVLEEVRNYDDYIKAEETLNDTFNDSMHEAPISSLPLNVLKDVPRTASIKAKKQKKAKPEQSPKQKSKRETTLDEPKPLIGKDEISFLQRDLKLFESLLEEKKIPKQKKKEQQERLGSTRSSSRGAKQLNQIKRTHVESELNVTEDQKVAPGEDSEEEDMEYEPSQEQWMAQHNPDLLTVTLRGKAVVIDPLCQLSDQKIIFPATPLHSCSIVPIYLSCPSKLAGPTCDCGKFIGLEDDPRAQVEAKFEFISSDSSLSIEPCSGILKHGENIKLNLIFKPKANRKEIENIVEEEKKNAAKGIHNRLTRRLGLSARGHSSQSKDLFNCIKEDYLKCTKKKALQVTVKCLIETISCEGPFKKRREVLTCELCCPIIRPDFVILAQDKQIIPYFELPCTGVGLKSQLPVEIHNLNWKTIYLRTSVLNTDNTFYTTIVPDQSSCLPHNFEKGIPLEPQGSLRFHVIFAPKTIGKQTEAIQFSANNTSVECKIGGISREAQYKMTPHFQLIKLEAMEGQEVQDIVKVENKGVLNIEVNVNNYFEREVSSKYIGGSTIRNFLVNKYEPEVSEDLKGLLKDVSLECQRDCPITVEPKALYIQPGSSGDFRITFFPQVNQNFGSWSKESEIMRSVDEEVCSYVKRVLITIGTSTVIADWTIVGLINNQDKSMKKQKKKKDKARSQFSVSPTP